MASIHDFTENMARGIANRTSRRSLLAVLGSAITGAAVIPVLPISRAAAATSGKNPQDPGDPTQCDYWRYCAIHGYLCSCCGGSASKCPPGSEMSPLTWVGTCTNPADGRAYIISYNDCCGSSSCGKCMCSRQEGDRPVVRPQSAQDIMWCLGTESGSIYNCSTAVIIGTALEK
ncbi:methylamine dehydrogenase light chain [Aquisediminimonas profunda]|uniref:methylamine dehydrogenase light chain n=1 Tax=Aquisediminimonas profunda TaxID=1550733 RepID=UPI001C6395B1|nr:methylamine dehydrogenase light chain [Aquisediminimonas profunda]